MPELLSGRKRTMYEKIFDIVQSVDDFVWGWWMNHPASGDAFVYDSAHGIYPEKIHHKGDSAFRVPGKTMRTARSASSAPLPQRLLPPSAREILSGWAQQIALGGPGAVLWCWLTGVFGIATKYAESLIAVKYRVKTADGRMQGRRHVCP